MTEKIIESLKQQWSSKYGLQSTDWEDVANVGASFITDAEQIPKFVEGAESIIRRIQSNNDSMVSLRKKNEELEKSSKTPPADPTPPAPKQEPNGNEELKGLLQQMLDAQKEDKARYEALQQELETLKNNKISETTLVDAKTLFDANPALKQYSNEGVDAWERALEVYTLGGSKMTAEELADKAKGYFEINASRRGYDAATFVPSDNTETKSAIQHYLEVRKQEEAAEAEKLKNQKSYFDIDSKKQE